jgi:hypothetical protein
LLERIVRSFRCTIGRGLPIGSLTSQHFANFYLSGLDRLFKETLRVKGYVRYMDDMAVWAEDRDELKRALSEATDYLHRELALEWKPSPYLNRCSHGMDFLGCRIFPRHITLNHRSRHRFCRRLARLEKECMLGFIDERQLQERVTALVAFTRTRGVSAWKFRRSVLQRQAVGGHRAPTG